MRLTKTFVKSNFPKGIVDGRQPQAVALALGPMIVNLRASLTVPDVGNDSECPICGLEDRRKHSNRRSGICGAIKLGLLSQTKGGAVVKSEKAEKFGPVGTVVRL